MDSVLPYAFGALAYFFAQCEPNTQKVMKGGNTEDMERIPALIALTNVYVMESSDRKNNLFNKKGGGKRTRESDDEESGNTLDRPLKKTRKQFLQEFKLSPASSVSITNPNNNTHIEESNDNNHDNQTEDESEYSSSEESKESEEPTEVDNRPTHTTELYEAVYNILQFADAKHDFKILWKRVRTKDEYNKKMKMRFNIEDSNMKVLGEEFVKKFDGLVLKSPFETDFFNEMIKHADWFFDNDNTVQRDFFENFITFDSNLKYENYETNKSFRRTLHEVLNQGVTHVVKDSTEPSGLKNVFDHNTHKNGFTFITPLPQMWDSQLSSSQPSEHPNINKSYFDTTSCSPKLLHDARNVPKRSQIPLFGIESVDNSAVFDFCNSTNRKLKISKRHEDFSPTQKDVEHLIQFLEDYNYYGSPYIDWNHMSPYIDWNHMIETFLEENKYVLEDNRNRCTPPTKVIFDGEEYCTYEINNTNAKRTRRIFKFLKFVRDDIGEDHNVTYEDLIMLAFDLKKTGDWGQVFWVKNNKSDTLFYSKDRLAALISIYCGNCTVGGFDKLQDPQTGKTKYAFIYRGHGFKNDSTKKGGGKRKRESDNPPPLLSKTDGIRDYERTIAYLKHPSGYLGQKGRGREPVIIQRRNTRDRLGMKADHASGREEVSSHLQKKMKGIYSRLEHMRKKASRKSASALSRDDIVFFEGMYVLFQNMPYIFNLIPAFGKAFDIDSTVVASDVRDVKIGIVQFVLSLPEDIRKQWSDMFETRGEAFYDAWAVKIGSVCDEIYSAVYAD